jgi:hypothetical protein
MRKDNVDLANAVVWIPDSKTPNGIAEVPLTPLAVQAFQASLPFLAMVRSSFPVTLVRRGTTRTYGRLERERCLEPKQRTFASTISVRPTRPG